MTARQDSDAGGVFAAVALGTLSIFYLVWGAMHDIAHGEADCSLEYAVLVLSVPAFAVIYRLALRRLPPRAKLVWLAATGALLLLFDLAAVNTKLHPRYAPDPVLATIFLTIGAPLLALVAYHLWRALPKASAASSLFRRCR